jgi:predicted lipoprotein with Yx(FWY)xxD motif
MINDDQTLGEENIMNIRLAVVSLGLMGLALAACGSTSSNTSSSSNSTKSSNASTISTGATVATSGSSGYGTILSSKAGQTYYVFSADTKNKSNCTGSCAKTWPPVIGSAPTISGGASSTLVGSLARANGQKQVTYDGHPLYTFSGDSGHHQTAGEGINAFGGYWYVISPAGKPITSSGKGSTYASSTSSSKGSSSSGSGSGSGSKSSSGW